MTQYPTITRDPIRPDDREPSCLPGLALFVWMVLSWVGVDHMQSLQPWGAAVLLIVTLGWLGWSWGRVWLVVGLVSLVAAVLIGHDGKSVALLWYQVFAGLTLLFGMALVYGPSIEHLIPTVVIVVLSLILFPVFAKEREKARQSVCFSNENHIATAVLQYAQDYDAHLPLSAAPWSEVVSPYVRSADASVAAYLACPADQDGPPSYQLQPSLRGMSLTELSQPENTVMLFESDDDKTVAVRHHEGACFGYVDGHAKWLSQQNHPAAIKSED